VGEKACFRSGTYVRQPLKGYSAFIPAPLPPEPPLRMDAEMRALVSDADRAIGRLDGVTELLPSPDWFVAMYVRKEAVYSAQIEGTQASLTDLFEFEAEALRKGAAPDVQEVVNYVRAMNYGLDRLQKLPLSLRLMREIHSILLEDVRGNDKEPGEFRKSQNWIGGGPGPANAVYIPPPPQEMLAALGQFELFLHDTSPMEPLVKCGLTHSQFETIHPFLDGNGRIGRLLIVFFLCWRGVLRRPLLYISDYLKRNHYEYNDRLQRVRDEGDWEGWMAFFLKGVRSVALEATERARRILSLQKEHRDLVQSKAPGPATAGVLLDYMFERPVFTIPKVTEMTGKSYQSIRNTVGAFEKLNLLKEITGYRRNRVYAYEPYLDLLERDLSEEDG